MTSFRSIAAPAVMAVGLLCPVTLLAADAAPLQDLPYHPSLDVSSLDRSVDPCVDLFQFSCGGWIQANPIPADQAAWDVYGKLETDNLQFLWGLLEDAAKPRPGRTEAERLTGDYFAACMDEAAIDKRGIAPLKDDLAAVDALSSAMQLPALVARLHRTGAGYPFRFGSSQDFADSESTIAWAFAGGLSLPDRDYYIKDDAKSKETRDRFVTHVEKMLQLAGDSPASAKASAQAVLALETELARASLTRVERRDPNNLNHRMTVAELQKTTPSFDWSAYLHARAVPELAGVGSLNVTQPKFFVAFEDRVAHDGLAGWKAYLRWHVIHGAADYLGHAFVDENFDFYRKYLRGVATLQPRWKRCVEFVDRDLGEALGQVFVAKTFPPSTRERAEEMTKLIEVDMGKRIRALDWMSAATKQAALEKLAGVRNKIGYPAKWRDYASVRIDAADFAGNVERAVSFEDRRQLGKIGKPLDRGEWDMTPPTVNAYYNGQMNDVNFPAGVLQPPLFDAREDDAPNYGNTGSTIGHELTHGFDDEGRKFDAHGNLRDWWTAEDARKFTERAQCVVDQYAGYVVVDDIHINSKLTLGEDIADLGGTILAWDAWKAAEAGKTLAPADGFTPEQRFFVGLAQWACGGERPESARVHALTDPHSPLRYRINGVVVNMPEFAAAFQCKPGQPLLKDPAKVCRIW